MKIIDVHVHYLPRDAFHKIAEDYPYLKLAVDTDETGRGYFSMMGRKLGPFRAGFFDPKKCVEDAKKRGVDISVISLPLTIPFFYDLDPDVALQLTRQQNDAISSVTERYRANMIGLGSVPLQCSNCAVEELRRCVRELGLGGVQIGSNVRGKNLDENDLRPFFEEANRLHVPVLIHPSGNINAERLKRYFSSHTIGYPTETSLAAASLIFGGVLTRFPNLVVILSHGGGFIPYQIGRLDNAYRTHPETKEKISDPPSKYLKRFYYDTVIYESKALEFLIEMTGSDRILMGSDYPFDMEAEDPVGFVTSLNSVCKQNKDRILSANAEKLFKVES